MLIEKLNNFLYGSKNIFQNVSVVITYISCFAAFGILIYLTGYNHTAEALQNAQIFVNLIFLLFILNYSLRLLYAFQRTEFLKSTWFEAFLMFVVSAGGISIFIFDFNLVIYLLDWFGFDNVKGKFKFLVNLFMFLLLIVETAKASTNLQSIRLKPATTFLLSFLMLILVGTGLLMLPAMTVASESMSFVDALFTATSAACVTGHLVVDTATYFTFKGQCVILFLFQLGGLGIVSFASFFATFIKKGVGIKHQTILQDFLSAENPLSSKGLLRQIVFITVFIEAMGFVAIFLTWGPEVKFNSIGDKVFASLFHSVSGFCNAGFSIFTDGLNNPVLRHAYILHITLALMVIVGGIGFTTIEDIFSPKRLRERLAMPWKDWKLSSKIAVYVSLALIVAGMVGFYALERGNSLAEMGFVEALIASFFQSVMTRTSGFNTVDISALHVPTMILMMFLMFIGASPGSTGGGIKTTTFYLIILAVITTIKDKKTIDISRRTIPVDLMYKANSVFAFAVSYNLLAVFALSITDPEIDILRLLFEQVSAFSTAGLSTGITPSLSVAGKLIITFSMYLGRVGTLTMALALSSKVLTTSYKYPKATIMVG